MFEQSGRPNGYVPADAQDGPVTCTELFVNTYLIWGGLIGCYFDHFMYASQTEDALTNGKLNVVEYENCVALNHTNMKSV
jgi:hypothetical protein